MSPITRLSLGILAIGIVASASAQGDSFIAASRTFEVPAATTVNTRDFVPAIDRSLTSRPTSPKNELIYNWKAADPNNRLRGGGVMPNRRTFLDTKFPGINFTGLTPPDPDLAVGPNFVVVVVNSSIGFFRKSDGQNTFLRTSNDFFAGLGATSFQFDPKVIYDTASGRFMILFLEVDFTNRISKSLIAVSDDSDPNGTWYRYRVESKLTVGSEEHWLDYPGFGASTTSVAFCGNMFGFGNSWAGNQYVVMPKSPMLTGAAFSASVVHDPNSASVKIAPVSDGPSLLALSVSGQDQLQVSSVTASGVLSRAITVPPALQPQQSVQGPSGHNLDALDGRLMNLQARAGTLVAAHGIWLPGGNRTVSRWYDIALNNWPTPGSVPTLTQSGNLVGASGESLHMPAVGKNARRDIAVVFSRTNATVQADLQIAGRKASDPLGSIGRPTSLASTPTLYGGQGVNRWGDYFGVQVDPVDNATFWAVGMVGRSDGTWTTQFFSFRVSDYSDVAERINPAGFGLLINQGTLLSGTTPSLFTVDSDNVRVQSTLPNTAGQVASLFAEYQTGLRASTVGWLRIDLNANTIPNGTWYLYLWNWTTNAYDLITTAPGTVGSAFGERLEGRASPYVSSTGVVRAAVRGLRPTRFGTGPFTLAVDRFSLLAAPRS